ncbi:MAG TPA: hypothetical protein V6D46_04850 [Coleofasciculaceae cyanobacterium]
MIDWLQPLLVHILGHGYHGLSQDLHQGLHQGFAALQTSSASEFSRGYCVQICAFLVPANLLATIQALVMMVLDRPLLDRLVIGLAGGFYATVMVLHVATWFAVGVVMAPTYVLLSLAVVCLVMNGAIIGRAVRSRATRDRSSVASIPAT